MKNRDTRLAAIVLAALATTPGYANPLELVQNGGFEINGGAGQLATGISYATGWTSALNGGQPGFNFIVNPATADAHVTGSTDGGFKSIFTDTANPVTNIFLWGPGNDSPNNNGLGFSPDGGYVLGGDGDYLAAAVSQAINGLTVGHTYGLSFDWAQSQFTDGTTTTTSGWGVTFGSDTVSTGTPTLAAKGFSGWNTFTHTFTATATSETLSFLATGTPTGQSPFALLDGVSLRDSTQPPSDVPEPASLALLVPGLAGLAVIRRRRKQQP